MQLKIGPGKGEFNQRVGVQIWTTSKEAAENIKSKTPWESDNRCTRPWPDKNGSDLWIPNLSFLSLNAENFAIKRV